MKKEGKIVVISLVQLVSICFNLCILVGVVIYFVYRMRKGGLKQMKERYSKIQKQYKLIILILLIGVIGFISMGCLFRSTKWENIPIVTKEEQAHIATSELLLPELSDYVNRQYRRSFRDTTYLYDTVWFDSAEQLFSHINFLDENQRMEMLQVYKNDRIETLKFNTLECGNMEVYKISEKLLPIQNEKLRDKDWQYSYYVIEDPDYGNHAKLICEKQEY